MGTQFTEIALRGLKAIAVALNLPIEQINYDALLDAIFKNLTSRERAARSRPLRAGCERRVCEEDSRGARRPFGAKRRSAPQ